MLVQTTMRTEIKMVSFAIQSQIAATLKLMLAAAAIDFNVGAVNDCGFFAGAAGDANMICIQVNQ